MRIMIAILLGTVAVSSAHAGPREDCRATIAGVQSPADDGCAGVTVCIEGPSDRCRLQGDVSVRSGGRRPLQMRAAAGSQCVTIPEGSGIDTSRRMRIKARIGKGRGRVLRTRAVPTCRGDEPTGGTCAGLAIPVPPIGRRAHFPPSIPTEGTCAAGGTASNYTTPAALMVPDQASELHVVGVYESDCLQMAPEWPFECVIAREPITVVVEPRPRPVVLALTAYERVRWVIEVRPGAVVERVLVGGYEAQQVEGVPASIVRTLETTNVAFGWEASQGGVNDLVATIREASGLVETSFQGCYTGARFTIPYAANPPTTCEPSPITGDEGIPQAEVAFRGCAAVRGESAACLSVVDGDLALVGTDSGKVCSLGVATLSPDPSDASLGWLGEVLYRCTYGAGLERIDLRSGAQERLEMPCEAVTDHAGVLLVTPGFFAGDFDQFGAVFRVAGYAGLVAADAERLSVSTWNSRFTAHGGRLYSAWHSTNVIDVQDLSSGSTVDQITLAGYDGWILGLDVTDDGRLFVIGLDDAGTLLMTFDVATGARLGEHRLGSSWGAAGLACLSSVAR